jgi:hypothetical protein
MKTIVLAIEVLLLSPGCISAKLSREIGLRKEQRYVTHVASQDDEAD